MDQYSADALRFLLLSSPLLNGEDYSLQDKDVADVSRKLAMVWNMYDFFTMYASVDNWEWDGRLEDPTADLKNPLDQWLVSRIHQLISEVNRYMQAYDVPNATKLILPFIEDASNWYVRRSRKRFWKSANDDDKDLAYRTLHYTLVQLSKVMAPFTPFLSEELYRQLTGGESVHLLDWPKAGKVNQQVIDEMTAVRAVINEGLRQRAAAGVKVRQPLKKISGAGEQIKIAQKYQDIVLEELHIKLIEEIPTLDHLLLDTEITDELREEGIMRELVRQIQNARKQAGLEVSDRIALLLETESPEIQQAIDTHLGVIKHETLATEVGDVPADAFEVTVKLDGLEVRIALAKQG